ncbi:hypothetical protein M6B38_343245 [Iris pallida]|uniref:Uncharacterized protein n=1 Tax=Iris pallida TaxID=29817 RepID=A0AAX6GV14_IRIPA|nr:hypothetical protein M6B38_343245 [Iris pallida]
MGFYCTSLIIGSSAGDTGMSLSGWPLSFFNVMLSVTGAQVETIPDPIYSQGSCDERFVLTACSL